MVLGLVVGFLLVEGLLRLGSLAVGPRAFERFRGDGGRLVLALGDSHTYGFRVEEEQTYPARLEALLEQRDAIVTRVVNLGLPGMSSGQVAAAFPGRIEALRPAIERRFDETGVRIVDAASHETLVVHEADSRERVPETRALGTLERDLWDIVRTAERLRVPLVFLVYAPTSLPNLAAQARIDRINDLILEEGRRHGVLVADPRPAFRRRLDAEGGDRSSLFPNAVDDHPNAAGYALVAATLAPLIVELETEGSAT